MDIVSEQVDKAENKTEVKKNKKCSGLDIGTANLLCARESNGSVVIKLQRDAFIDIEKTDFTRKMLEKMNVQYVIRDNTYYVLGEDSFELANILNRSTRRPMKNGFISADEADAIPIIKLLIESVLGGKSTDDELVYFSAPANPIDSELNVVYHEGMMRSILTNLGYRCKTLIEGHAVVFSEMEKSGYTGIGISCGAGLCNLSVSYRGLPAISFSVARGGDWIDKNASVAVGKEMSRMTAIKESGIDINAPKNPDEIAISLYYQELIRYVLNNIKKKFELAKDLPHFKSAVPIVCAGGTSMVGGFVDVFKNVLSSIKFPILISEVRLAEEPLNAVAKGCLISSLLDE
jgi:actin-like ATPase involved in cell morphogenesis